MKAKKSLGQNFLKSIPALNNIVKAGEIEKDDTILEIGPGKGALTEKLLQTGARVIAVEKDFELFEFLKEKFAEQIKSSSLVLVHEDILELEFGQNLLERTLGRSVDDGQRKFLTKNFRGESENVLPEFPRYKIIANIPYNITGAILKKFLTEKHQPERMVLMVQNEVAKRIVARDGKESILSISVKAYGEPKMIMKVPARYFSPAPKVDSAVIAINNISRKFFTSLPPPPFDIRRTPPPSQGGGKMEVQAKDLNSLELEQKFWEIVKAGFAHKRKKLSSNLKHIGVSYAIGNSYVLLENKRAEELTLEDWLALVKAL